MLDKWSYHLDGDGMTLHIRIPENLDDASVRQLDRDVREFVAVQLYRQGKLSHGKFAKFLGIGRGDADALLGRYGVVDEFTAGEIAEQVNVSRSLRRRAP
jgi:predicted HTH domain antitoxin